MVTKRYCDKCGNEKLAEEILDFYYRSWEETKGYKELCQNCFIKIEEIMDKFLEEK